VIFAAADAILLPPEKKQTTAKKVGRWPGKALNLYRF
jgi:hypothetical protein